MIKLHSKCGNHLVYNTCCDYTQEFPKGMWSQWKEYLQVIKCKLLHEVPLTIKKKKKKHSHRTKANSFVLSLFSLVFWSIIIVNFENQYRGQKGCELDLFIRRVYGWASWSESEKQGFSTNSWVWWFENCKFQNIGLSFHTASLAFATIFPL